MGWGTGGGALLAAPAEDDHALVEAVRAGDDRAFERLYERYHRRIAAYAASLLKDHGRAEDVTQEAFVSALRRIRATEQPIAFKPWIYEIARNACIDQFRRTRRTEEVPFDGDDGAIRLAAAGPSPEAAVAAKQDLADLCGAFGGLSDVHHEILVLRELEGLSYREIGERLNLSRPAVESTLFRARRRLAQEYDELVTGARCRRVRRVIEASAVARLGARDARRLAQHVSHCTACRRAALAAGVDPALLTRVPLRRRVAARVAGLLPLPGFARLGRTGDAPLAPGGGSRWVAELPAIADSLGGGWGKVATLATVVVAGVGATGVGTHDSAGPVAQPREQRPAAPVAAPEPSRTEQAVRVPATREVKTGTDAREPHRGRKTKRRTTEASRPKASDATPLPKSAAPPPAEAGAPVAPAGAAPEAPPPPAADTPDVPKVEVPATVDPAAAAEPVTDTVEKTVPPVVDTVEETVDELGDTTNQVAEPPVEPPAAPAPGLLP